MACAKPGSLIRLRHEERAVVTDIFYLYLEHAGRIHLLYLFSKSEQADLSPDQKRIIGALSQAIREEIQ
jgi:hypothetical protein